MSLNPANADEAVRQAMALHQQGQLQRAEAIYRQVLSSHPNHPDALHLLGVIAMQVRQPQHALPLIERSVRIAPHLPAAWSNLGEAHRLTRNFERAIETLLHAISLDPKLASAYSNLGLAYRDVGRIEQAVEALTTSLQLDPALLDTATNLAGMLCELGRLDEAIATLNQALNQKPDFASALNNLGVIYERQGGLVDAESAYRRAIAIEPTLADAWTNLGHVRQKQRDYRDARSDWSEALRIAPNHPNATWNLALLNLLEGDYTSGLAQYESRFQCTHSSRFFRHYPQPRWDGSELAGKRILLYPEQALGDVIQFARFARAVAAKGGEVILEVPDSLLKLAKSVPGVTEVAKLGLISPPFDTHLHLMSVPTVLKLGIADLPARDAYMTANPEDVQRWRPRVEAGGRGFRVGLVWTGRALPDPMRSIPTDVLGTLARVSRVNWYSFQTGEGLPHVPNAPMPMVDLGSDFKDFSDTAACAVQMDLILTIDTSMAHLSGALNCPTWTLIPFAPDWRWGTSGETSLWYPGMRLFRQDKCGDWTGVLQQVAAALQDSARDHAANQSPR
jgi:tetratricopeptide (TPR) repeat protein